MIDDNMQALDMEEDDGASFMGRPSRKGTWRWVDTSSDRRRRRTRPREEEPARHPWRERTPTRERGIRSTETTRSMPSHATSPEEPSVPTQSESQNANRVTWRTLLAMNDSGPGMDFDAKTDHALDETQCANILCTIDNLPVHERMTLLTGFTCFIQELTVQVMSMFVTGTSVYDNPAHTPNPPARERDEEETDEVAHMQFTRDKLKQVRHFFGEVQTSLGTTETHRSQKASTLLHHLQHIQPELATDLQEEMQSLMAFLLVHAEDERPDAKDVCISEDVTWAKTWMSKLHTLLPRDHSTSRNSPGSSSTMVVLDTQPNLTAENERSEHDIRESQEEQRREEEETLRIVREYEAAEAARAHQIQEDRDFQEAMNAPKKAKTEATMMVDIEVGAGDSRARFLLPAPSMETPLSLSISIRPSETARPSAPHNDDVALVQTNAPRIRRSQRSRLFHLLQGLHVQLRRRTSENVKKHLQGVLHGLLQQISGALGMLEGLDISAAEDADPAVEGEVSAFTNMIVGHIGEVLGNIQQLAPEDELHDVLLEMGTTFQDFVATDPESRRRRTASSSGTLRPATMASTQSVQNTAEAIRDSLDRAVLIQGPEARDDVRREVVAHMVSEAQLHASRLRVMLLLLEHYLPQPRRTVANPMSSRSTLGAAIWRDHRQWLHEAFSTAVESLGDGPFGMEEAIHVMDGLSNMAIEVMSFLEGADLISNSGVEGSDGEPLGEEDDTTADVTLPQRHTGSMLLGTSTMAALSLSSTGAPTTREPRATLTGNTPQSSMCPPTTMGTPPPPRTPTPKKRKLSPGTLLGEEDMHRTDGLRKGSPPTRRAEGSSRASTGSAAAADAKDADRKGRGQARQGQQQGQGSLKQGIDRIFGKK